MTNFKNQDKNAEIDFFNKFDDKLGYDSLTEQGYQTLLKAFMENLQPAENEIIGDFGCGSAAFGRRVKDQSKAELIGVDMSPELIKANIKRWPDIPFHIGDIEYTEFKDNSFDIIIYSGVLHHFPDFSNVANEAYRLLKPGGRIFAYDPHYYNPAMWAYRAKASPIHSTKGRTINERLLTKNELKSVWLKSGFNKVCVDSRSGVGISYLESKRMSLFLNAYNLFDNILHWTFADRLFGSFVLTYAYK